MEETNIFIEGNPKDGFIAFSQALSTHEFEGKNIIEAFNKFIASNGIKNIENCNIILNFDIEFELGEILNKMSLVGWGIEDLISWRHCDIKKSITRFKRDISNYLREFYFKKTLLQISFVFNEKYVPLELSNDKFKAICKFSYEDNCYFGSIEPTNGSSVSFDGRNIHELKEAFKEACEDYEEFCKRKGIETKS